MDRFIATALFLLLFVSSVSAIVQSDSMKIYAVTSEGEGLVATLDIKIEPGSGKVWSAVTPLVGTSTQNAEKTAINVAKKFYNRWDSYDYKFTINSTASVVDGPSAGAAMTLLVVSMLTDRDFPDNVSITGTITPEGRVGPVGGVFEKAREASKTGTKLFLIPKGEAIQTVKLPEGVRSVNILEYAPQNWDMKVAEVQTIEQAINFAHADIEKIDVNSSASGSVPEFVPEKISLKQGLAPFKTLTSNYIAETKQVTSEARTALSSSLLEDATVTHALLEVLNNSEQALSRAEILNEQNYLYSAANFAFLSRVNAIVVKEVASNPELLQDDSTSLDLRLIDMKRELESFKNDLDGPLPKNGIEWHASAQQRHTYATITVDKLMSTKTIVVGASESEQDSAEIANVQDYAFAVAWLDVSKDFYNLSKGATEYVNRTDQFETAMDPLIAAALIDLNSINDDSQKEDIERRVNSAREEKDSGWFEASYFDAASAMALAEAQKTVQGMDQKELKETLEAKIKNLDDSIFSSSNSGWASLYLDHAKYFLAAANYYEQQGFSENASENLRSGIGLATLAGQIFTASSEVSLAYENEPVLSSQDVLSGSRNPFNSQSSSQNGFILIAGGLFLVAITLALSLLLVGAIHRKGTVDLEAQRKELAGNIIAADSKHSEIDSYKERLALLRARLNEGIITRKEFEQKSNEYLSDIEKLRTDLKKISTLPNKRAFTHSSKKPKAHKGIRDIAKQVKSKRGKKQ
ncbi:MAG TPA: S16 family serine protease [archaeon]|nr:S16 family serine protease [archaeon]